MSITIIIILFYDVLTIIIYIILSLSKIKFSEVKTTKFPFP